MASRGHEIPISHHPSDKSSWNTLVKQFTYTVRQLMTNVQTVTAISSSSFPAYLEMFTKCSP